MNGDCNIEEFTYRESSTSPWVTIPILDAGLNLTSGDSLLITDTKAEYIYQCYYSSSSGSVSPYFYFSNGTCTNENTFCDCDQNVWDSDALGLLGNGEDNVGYEGEGIGVNFNCLTWAYDCGDLGLEGDPIGVCEGVLPPENGCISLIFGCSEEGACNYNESVNFDDGSCDFESCLGCTDPEACNFASTATQDDGSCDFESCLGCPDPTACNYIIGATQDDGSCDYSCLGCTDVTAFNFDPTALIDDDSCIYECVSPIIDWVVSTCEGGFLYIDFNVTDLGNTGPWNMVNNISTGTMVIDELGAYELGPFSSGDVVVCTLISQLFSSCIATYPTLSCTNSITEVNQLDFNVYPNPANELINIEFESATTGEVVIYSSNGQLVVSEPLQSMNRVEISTDNLAEGIYTVVLVQDTGISRKTLIVTH